MVQKIDEALEAGYEPLFRLTAFALETVNSRIGFSQFMRMPDDKWEIYKKQVLDL